MKNTFGRFGERDYPYPEPEWTPENMNRKSGDTTFKQCGWCEHTSSGTCRYNCYLSASCSLLKDYGIGSNLYWDTPCVLMMLGKDDIQSIVRSKEYDIESSLNSIKRSQKELSTVLSLDIPARPPLAENREASYYKDGDVVWIFGQTPARWDRGIVVPGYRSGDGCVIFVLDDDPNSRPKPDGNGPWGCGYSVPCVLKDWEYNYFKEHHDEFRNWLDLQDRSYNGDRLPLDLYFDSLVKLKEEK